jgi:hypothetical protein
MGMPELERYSKEGEMVSVFDAFHCDVAAS